jgi:hypothetical protein
MKSSDSGLGPMRSSEHFNVASGAIKGGKHLAKLSTNPRENGMLEDLEKDGKMNILSFKGTYLET